MNLAEYFRGIDLKQEGKLMYRIAERLFPICRSITGNGVRETLSILKDFIPLNIVEVPSGSKAFDWEIPDEWNIMDAWIKNPDGEKIVDFKKLNLHVLNYSEPVDKRIDLNELKKHLFTLPEYPDWVPYRTSYYNRQWGFCLPHKQYENLKDGEYHVRIDSKINPGSLTYGEYRIQGKRKDEVLLSCHICHPSLANDNLSGIVLATNLARLLGELELNFSYRFLFVPATIGSITWLSRNENKLANIKHGMVLSLLGDSSPFQYKCSRQGNTELDSIMKYLIGKERGAKLLDFTPYGYDERQYCSPGFNLPVGRLTRNPFGEYPEYHTSADNLDFINFNNLSESIALLFKVITIIEGNKKWGKTIADKVRLRITEFEAALSLEDISKLPPARCHEFSNNRAGQLSVVLNGKMRLIFMPNHDPVPKLPSGGLDWSKVTEIFILEVKDYHG